MPKSKSPAKKAIQTPVSSQQTAASSQSQSTKKSKSPQKKPAKIVQEEEKKSSKSPRTQNLSESPNSDKSKSPSAKISKKSKIQKTQPDLSNQNQVPPTFNDLQGSPQANVQGSSAPKKPLSNFLFFSIENQAKLRDLNPDMKTPDISKLIGQSWNNLEETQKKIYQELAEQDKIRYQKESDHLEKYGFFINAKGENSKDLFKPIFGDDIVKPKKPLTSFLFYSQDNRKTIKEKNQDLVITEIAKVLGQNWNKMTEKQKGPFVIKAQRDVLRYEKEMDELVTQGFFTNQDGVKSTDMVVKKKMSKAVSSKDEEPSPVIIKRKAMTEPAKLEEKIVKKSPKRVKK